MGLCMGGKGVNEWDVLVHGRGERVEGGYTSDFPFLTLAERKPVLKLFLIQ